MDIRNLNPKQKLIFDHVKEHGQITKKEADELLKPYYYFNHSKYVSEILQKMVMAKILCRSMRGRYLLTVNTPANERLQQTLF